MSPTSTIRIQSVLFGQSCSEIDRYLRGVRQAVVWLRKGELPIEVDLRVGDCSNVRRIAEAEVEEVKEALLTAGVRSFEYQFFGANLGHGGAQNRLLTERAGTDFVLILNPDTCLAPRALFDMLGPMADPTVAIVEARQLPLEHQKDYNKVTGDTSWASGACSLVRCAVFDEAGLFDDTTFFLYCDDVDFSWRCRLAGHRVVHEPSATVFHDKSLSSTGMYLPSEAENYYSVLASVLLPAKYSRPDVVRVRLAQLDFSPEAIHERAAAEFRRREIAGRLPEPLDPGGTVAQFQTTAYADVRFDYVI